MKACKSDSDDEWLAHEDLKELNELIGSYEDSRAEVIADSKRNTKIRKCKGIYMFLFLIL
jgi:hypothetical protein